MAPTDTPFAPPPHPNARARTSARPEWRDDTPAVPAPDVLARHGALVLDPLSALRLPGQPAPQPVAYVADQLLVPRPVAFAPDLRRVLAAAAAAQGLAWEGLPDLAPDGSGRQDGGPEDRDAQDRDAQDRGSEERAAAPRPRRADVDPRDPVVVGRLVPQGSRPVAAPDAWAVLQGTRTRAEALGLRADVAGLSLNHLFQAGSHVAGHPVVGMSHVAGHPVSEPEGLAEYVMAGSGGRAPVAWVGERPAYDVDGWTGRRPVVAVLDTGCGQHPWFEDGVTTHAEWGGTTAEIVDPATDPERTGDVIGPLDGQLDTHSGHGTFIAGLIRQICPKADIWALRVMSSDGIVEERDLIRALGVLNGLVADAVAAGNPPPVDIVSLSLGYYHELPNDQDFDPVLLQQLQALGRAGVAVVACAGNDATTREMYPAAFLPHDNGVVETVDAQCIPVVSVGALNPDGSVALFSNGGAWVGAWDVGAALVSTFPTTFDGGSQPSISMPTSLGRPRATIDPDCFAGGFGTWSGTSFSTPVLAGRLARALLSKSSAEAKDQLSRVWAALTQETGIGRPDA
jgi:subtilase family protein